MSTDARRAVEAVWRIEAAHVVAALARHVGDVSLAEDLAQEAFAAALEEWPEAGVPANPRAWLVVVAKRRFVDGLRRGSAFEARQPELFRQHAARQHQATEGEFDAAGEEVADDVLRLMFTACHPVLSKEARAALTLRLVGGLTTEQIARAYGISTAAVAQRIVRAKRTLVEARVAFELPPVAKLAERLSSVLEVLYLVFNEGHVATSGPDWAKPELCFEALRLGRVLAALLPGEGEVHGLVALMELQSSRLRARVGPAGEALLLAEQDRSTWDSVLIGRGLAALERAAEVGGELGRYGLEAAIASLHARAPSFAETDWCAIAALYEALAERAPSPVVELNRAVALSLAYGPEAAFELVESLAAEPFLSRSHLYWSVRADLLARLGRPEEASSCFSHAAGLTRNEGERRLLLARSADLSK